MTDSPSIIADLCGDANCYACRVTALLELTHGMEAACPPSMPETTPHRNVSLLLMAAIFEARRHGLTNIHLTILANEMAMVVDHDIESREIVKATESITSPWVGRVH